MKQKIYILGLITVLIVFTGLVFKINHFAGAGVLLSTGIGIFVVIFMPIALRNHFKAEGTRQNLPLYIVTWLTCFVVFTGMLFKIMHWPHAGTMLLVALPFPYVVFLPVFLTVTSKNKNFSIYNTVFVLMLLVFNSVFTTLLGLNVTKNRIDDSYNLSRNYQNFEDALSQLPENTPETSLNLRIDEALKMVNEYQEIILKHENMTAEQWQKNPESLQMPDTRGRSAQALIKAGDTSAGTKLFICLKALTKEMGNTPGYKNLAELSPVIFDLEVPSGNDEEWSNWKFSNNSLSWVLIYLDGIETNLKMIKATVTAGI
jgi:hypothetical protein